MSARQLEFRPGYSCTTALADRTCAGWEKGKHSGFIWLDMNNDKISQSVIHCFDFHISAINLVSFLFSDRTQSVVFAGVASSRCYSRLTGRRVTFWDLCSIQFLRTLNAIYITCIRVSNFLLRQRSLPIT